MKEIQELIKELQTVAERCDIDDNYDINDAAEDVREIAGRLEKAVIPCNQLAIHKAMEEIKAIIKVWNRALVSTKRTIDTIDEIATQVFETPPRNCDIGNADEQETRFTEFCDAHKYVGDYGELACSSKCPFYNKIECGIHWGQMIFEEGEDNEKK